MFRQFSSLVRQCLGDCRKQVEVLAKTGKSSPEGVRLPTLSSEELRFVPNLRLPVNEVAEDGRACACRTSSS
jgi:hypothetical protein